MRRSLLVSALVASMLLTRSIGADAAPGMPSPGAEAACPDPATIVRKLQERYDETRAFRAEFRQETRVASLGVSDVAEGTVVFKKPGKMRWDFQTPQAQQIVSDGTTLWIHQPVDRQVLKMPFRGGFVSTTPVSFLAGVGRIKDDFDVEIDRRGCNAQRVYLKLMPKSSPDIGSLTLAVTRPAHDIVEAAVTDPIGNVTTLSFSNLERNVEPAEDEFQFVVPEGVDVVSAPGGAPPR